MTETFALPWYGGEGGIRTHGPIAGTHAFQACRFDHSRTSPYRFSRGGILTCGLVTGKVTSRAHRHGFDLPGSPSYTAKKSTRIIHKGSWQTGGVARDKREEREERDSRDV